MSVCVSSGVVSPSSTMKASTNTQQDPDDPEPADEEDIQMEYSSD
jgi:hypothetical protein